MSHARRATHRDAVVDPEDVFDAQGDAAEHALHVLRSFAKGGRTFDRCARSAEIVGDSLGMKELIDRIETALIPNLFEPSSDNRSILIFVHAKSMR